MSDYSVNGQNHALPISEDASLQELIEYVRRQWTSENSLVTSIRINGTDLSSSEELQLGDVPVHLVDRIEVFTAHPREIAEETLQMLKTFTDGLISLSQICGDGVGQAEAEGKFLKLIEGMATFHEALSTVKKILRLEEDPRFSELYQHEGALLAILKEILGAKEARNTSHLRKLLKELLPQNLVQWRDDVIPSIIRARDS